jgi:hypothetical protein
MKVASDIDIADNEHPSTGQEAENTQTIVNVDALREANKVPDISDIVHRPFFGIGRRSVHDSLPNSLKPSS